MPVSSLRDETSYVNNSSVENINIGSISKPDKDLPFVEEVHHNRMRRNTDSLKPLEVLNVMDRSDRTNACLESVLRLIWIRNRCGVL